MWNRLSLPRPPGYPAQLLPQRQAPVGPGPSWNGQGARAAPCPGLCALLWALGTARPRRPPFCCREGKPCRRAAPSVLLLLPGLLSCDAPSCSLPSPHLPLPVLLFPSSSFPGVPTPFPIAFPRAPEAARAPPNRRNRDPRGSPAAGSRGPSRDPAADWLRFAAVPPLRLPAARARGAPPTAPQAPHGRAGAGAVPKVPFVPPNSFCSPPKCPVSTPKQLLLLPSLQERLFPLGCVMENNVVQSPSGGKS